MIRGIGFRIEYILQTTLLFPLYSLITSLLTPQSKQPSNRQLTGDESAVFVYLSWGADELQLLHHLRGGALLQRRACERDAEPCVRAVGDIIFGKN